MDISKQFELERPTIRVSTEDSGKTPLIVHRETLLSDVPPRGQDHFVLVCDDNRRIIGVVGADEIDRRLLASNQFERTRWGAMPIGAMSKLSLAETPTNGPKFSGELQCGVIRQGDSLLGLSVEGDLFFSWKQLETLFSEALSDPLTGLMNRLAYERRLQEEWNRSLRTNNSIGVVVVDLDDFKKINDTYGHAAGDQVLLEVGRQLEYSMRSYDVVARFGGDEFVALCLGCAPGDINIPLNRVQESLSAIRVKAGGEEIRVSASIGAAVRHSGFEHCLPEDLFVAADSCLYEAKESKAVNKRAWKTEIDGDGKAGPTSVQSTQTSSR